MTDTTLGCYNPAQWLEYFVVSTLYGLILSQFPIAVIGGNAFAGERADRSAEFLVSLPISRKRILTSKLLFSLTIILVVWLTSLLLLTLLTYLIDQTGIRWDRDLNGILSTRDQAAIAGTMFFCVAWCLSSFLTSCTFSALGGLVAPLLVWTGILFIEYLFGVDVDDPRFLDLALSWYRWICLTLAPVCFGVGTWYYLRRAEP